MKIKQLTAIFASLLFLIACEKEFNPDLPTTTDDVVVEGYIEGGQNAAPTFVILTKSIPFFRELTNTNDLFVKNAEVWVSNGKDSVRLQQFCWQDLDSTTRRQAAQAFGLEIDSVAANFNFCVYIDFLQRVRGEAGKTYNLRVKLTDGRVLTAQTTIPRLVPILKAEFIKPPGTNQNDSFTQLRAMIQDPKGADYYRYFTSVNDSGYVAGGNSVTDDAFFDGLETKFNLLKSEPRNRPVDPDNFGLFRRGDTISIKFCTIDKAHFDFWSTLEYNANSGGSPFSSYTRVRHNIKGGMGIWGGYGVTYLDTIVPRK